MIPTVYWMPNLSSWHHFQLVLTLASDDGAGRTGFDRRLAATFLRRFSCQSVESTLFVDRLFLAYVGFVVTPTNREQKIFASLHKKIFADDRRNQQRYYFTLISELCRTHRFDCFQLVCRFSSLFSHNFPRFLTVHCSVIIFTSDKCSPFRLYEKLTSSICWLRSFCALATCWFVVVLSNAKLPGTTRTRSRPTAESRAISKMDWIE